VFPPIGRTHEFVDAGRDLLELSCLAAEEQRLVMSGQAKTQEQVRFARPGLPTEEQFIGRAKVR